MGAFEKLLRKTLEQQGGRDAQSREKVYQSARIALVRLLEKQQNLSAEQVKLQQNNLEKAIADVDTEYRVKYASNGVAQAASSTPEEAPIAAQAVVGIPAKKTQETATPSSQILNAPSQFPTQVDRDVPNKAPAAAAPKSPKPRDQPKLNIPSMSGNGTAEDVSFNDENKKHPFAKLMLWSTLGAFLVLGAWWVYEQQLFVPLSVRDGAVPNPQRSLESEDFSPKTSGVGAADQVVSANGTKSIEQIKKFPKVSDSYKTDGKGWIDVLDPRDPRGVILNDRGTAELLTENGEKILRLRSFKEADTADKNERAIKIEIGNGLAENLAGKTVNLLLEMRSSDKDKHKISVVCAFGALGQCGRRWYQVSPEKENVLIEFELQDGDVQPGSNFLLIYTDDENMGKGVDIYGIKMMTKES